MSDDILQRATKALREQGGAEPPSDRAAFMRARVLSQAKRSSRLRPQGVWQWAAVVSLGFFATTAMAQVIAVQLPKVIEALRREPAAEKAKPKPAKPARPVQPRAAKPVEPAAVPTPSEPAAPSVLANPANSPAQPAQDAATAPPPSPRPGKRAAQKRSSSASLPPQQPMVAPAVVEPEPEPAPAPEAPPPEARAEQVNNAPAEAAPAPSTPPKAAAPEPAELALFRRAQALHLQHDPRAIDAWDAFLRVAGASALAPEARYNRALGLVRASRFGEARKALRPFAEGKYGSYRKQEASSLLARLPK